MLKYLYFPFAESSNGSLPAYLRRQAQAGTAAFMYYVYFLRSEVKSNWIYVGSTGNYNLRLTEHNTGRVKSTKPFRPYKIIYLEEFNTVEQALAREKYFKLWKGRLEKKEIIRNCGIV